MCEYLKQYMRSLYIKCMYKNKNKVSKRYIECNKDTKHIRTQR